ncbi:MAG: hypothetical protein M1132_11670 [Chloroflexi bacterium]|nr:hypothetical protein [Chloroflexota bacterium]MCL5952360.1 hypothetical protein [Chloroflexota bacterium]
MGKRVGLWIDHHKAVIVTITDQGEETSTVESNLDKHVRFAGGQQEISAEDQFDRRFSGYLRKYYDEIIMQIREAESILILGPGEAKTELERRLERDRLAGRILSIETVDKMTDRQIAAQVRERLAK